jgi:hypothetical protein
MRLSEWRAAAPHKDAMTPKVLAVVEPVLTAMGAAKDPDCWVAWGDDPLIRYVILAPTPAGLIACNVRLNIPQGGPRASAKLVRWPRVQLGEMGIETQEGHRMVSFQVEGQILRGADANADRIAQFALGLMDAVDGRPMRAAPIAGKGATRPRKAGTARADGTRSKASPKPKTEARTHPAPRTAAAGG